MPPIIPESGSMAIDKKTNQQNRYADPVRFADVSYFSYRRTWITLLHPSPNIVTLPIGCISLAAVLDGHAEEHRQYCH
jgi:hypothetical protein